MEQPDSIFDQVDENRRAQAIAEARESLRAGRVSDHSVVGRWLLEAAEALENGRPMPPAPLSDRR